jgi:hypothetical protein
VAVLSPARAAPFEGLPEEFITQLQALNPRIVVPSSCQFVQEPWSWYNHAMFPVTYARFEHEVRAALPHTSVLRLNPSVSVVLDADGVTAAAQLPWVIPEGPQDLDFDYRPAQTAPSTAEIAGHFAALDGAAWERARQYCTAGLLDKYRAMELEEGGYFDSPRIWRLSLYDAGGDAAEFHYRVHGDEIALLASAPVELDWTTELPAVKLIAALESGESLTSMYVRINDRRFSPAVEAQLADAEVVDDPLIRCLFNGVFGAYQAAQLARLR